MTRREARREDKGAAGAASAAGAAGAAGTVGAAAGAAGAAAGGRAEAARVREVWRGDRWVKPFFKQYRKALVAALVLGILAFVFASALMFSSGYLISLSASSPDSFLNLMVPMAFVQVFGIGKPLLQYFERLSSHDWVLRMTSSLRLKLYRALEKDALFFRATHRTGDVLGLLDEDIGHLQNLYLRTIFPTIVAWTLFAIVVVVAGCWSVPLALGLLVLLGVEIFVVPIVSVLANAARRSRSKELRNELYAELTDNVLGVSDWVFSGRGEEYLESYRAVDAQMRELTRAENAHKRKRDLVAQLLFGLVATLLLVWAGAAFGAEGTWPDAANWIAAVALAFFPLIDAFAPVPQAVVDAFSYEDSVERLNALPDVEEDGKGGAAEEGSPDEEESPAEEEGPAPAAVVPAAPAAALPQEPLDLHIEGVSFSYPDSPRKVLDGLSLDIPQGQKVAVLGRSGAGKSTFATLVRGDIVPDEGVATLGGAPTSGLGDAASRYFGVIQQQTYLFNMTLLDNLRIGRADASVDEVWMAVAKVGLLPMVERLPEGLGTMVDEAGLRFSGGERHRIALARVLLQDAPIVILDEPTVGLDPLTERELLQTLFATLEGKTVIMITHHLAGVSLMDRVVFIEDGRTELDGSPAELERTSPRYRELLAFDH